jgi:hypothetical protein
MLAPLIHENWTCTRDRSPNVATTRIVRQGALVGLLYLENDLFDYACGKAGSHLRIKPLQR